MSLNLLEQVDLDFSNIVALPKPPSVRDQVISDCIKAFDRIEPRLAMDFTASCVNHATTLHEKFGFSAEDAIKKARWLADNIAKYNGPKDCA